MNQKSAKKLRQLVKHLMVQGAIAPTGWHAYTPDVRAVETKKIIPATAKKAEQIVTTVTNTNALPNTIFGGTIRLDAACGRAIYQQMKKRAISHRV